MKGFLSGLVTLVFVAIAGVASALVVWKVMCWLIPIRGE
jgi:hypothetical protein